MAKLFSLLLFLGYVATSCERSDKNVEAVACDPKVSKCAGKSSTPSDQSAGSTTNDQSSTTDSTYPTDTPDPGSTTFNPTSTPTPGDNSTGGSATAGDGSTTGGGSETGGGSGGGSETGGGSGGGGSGGGGSGGGSETGDGGPPPTGGGSSATTGSQTGGGPTTSPSNTPAATSSPIPLQTIDPTFQVTPLGVTASLDGSSNLKVILPPQSVTRITDMTYSISVGSKAPEQVPAQSTPAPDAAGFRDVGPVVLNLMLSFKFDGKPCQSETNLVQGPTPATVETRCRP